MKMKHLLWIFLVVIVVLGSSATVHENHHEKVHKRILNHHSNRHFLHHNKRVAPDSNSTNDSTSTTAPDSNSTDSSSPVSISDSSTASLDSSNTTNSSTIPPESNSTNTNSNETVSSLHVFYNTSASLWGVFNETAHAARVELISANLIGFINGEKAVAYVYSINSSEFHTIQNPGLKWQDNESVTQFASRIGLLLPQQAESVGQNGTKVQDISEELLNELSEININVGRGSALKPEKLEKYLTLATQRIEALNGPLKGFYEGAHDLVLPKSQEGHDRITFLISIDVLLGELFKNVNGGYEALKQQGLKLDKDKINNATDGFSALLLILDESGENLDLGKTYGPSLNNPEALFKLITVFDDDSPVDRIFKIVYNIIHLQQNGSLVDAVSPLVKLVGSGDFPDLQEIQTDRDHILNILQQQAKKFNGSQSLSGFKDLLAQIRSENFVYLGTNYSQIVRNLIQGGPGDGLHKVIDIIHSLNLTNPISNLQTVFHQVIHYLNNTSNPSALSNLLSNNIPGLEKITSGPVSILKQLFQNGNFKDILGQSSNISDAFTKIPVFGDIIKSFTHEGFNANQLFQSGSFLKGLNSTIGQFEPVQSIFKQFSGDFLQIIQQPEHIFENAFNQFGGNGSNGESNIFGQLFSNVKHFFNFKHAHNKHEEDRHNAAHHTTKHHSNGIHHENKEHTIKERQHHHDNH